MSRSASAAAQLHGPVECPYLNVRISACSVGPENVTFEHTQRADGALVFTLKNFTGQLICRTKPFDENLEDIGAYCSRDPRATRIRSRSCGVKIHA